MGSVALTLTGMASVIAFRFWLKFFEPRVKKMKHPVEMGNVDLDGGIIGNGQADPFRTFINSASFALAVLILGLPHLLNVWGFWSMPKVDVWNYIHYSWSLIYWLVLMSAPAFCVVRQFEAKARRLAGSSAD